MENRMIDQNKQEFEQIQGIKKWIGMNLSERSSFNHQFDLSSLMDLFEQSMYGFQANYMTFLTCMEDAGFRARQIDGKIVFNVKIGF